MKQVLWLLTFAAVVALGCSVVIISEPQPRLQTIGAPFGQAESTNAERGDAEGGTQVRAVGIGTAASAPRGTP